MFWFFFQKSVDNRSTRAGFFCPPLFLHLQRSRCGSFIVRYIFFTPHFIFYQTKELCLSGNKMSDFVLVSFALKIRCRSIFCWIKSLTSSLCVSLAVRLCVPTRSLVTRSVPVQSAGMLRCYLLPTDRHKFSIFLRFCGSHSKVSKEISERPIQKCHLFFFFFFSPRLYPLTLLRIGAKTGGSLAECQLLNFYFSTLEFGNECIETRRKR